MSWSYGNSLPVPDDQAETTPLESTKNNSLLTFLWHAVQPSSIVTRDLGKKEILSTSSMFTVCVAGYIFVTLAIKGSVFSSEKITENI